MTKKENSKETKTQKTRGKVRNKRTWCKWRTVQHQAESRLKYKTHRDTQTTKQKWNEKRKNAGEDSNIVTTTITIQNTMREREHPCKQSISVILIELSVFPAYSFLNSVLTVRMVQIGHELDLGLERLCLLDILSSRQLDLFHSNQLARGRVQSHVYLKSDGHHRQADR